MGVHLDHVRRGLAVITSCFDWSWHICVLRDKTFQQALWRESKAGSSHEQSQCLLTLSIKHKDMRATAGLAGHVAML